MNFNINIINIENLCLFCEKIFVKYLNNLKVLALFLHLQTNYFKYFRNITLKPYKIPCKKLSSKASRNIFFYINFYKA